MLKNKPLVRHELKAEICQGQYICLKSCVSNLMHKDPHMGSAGYYIRSVYFDDVANRGYYDKVEGLYHRYKLRIRFYDFESEVIKFEIKGKKGDRVMKHTENITRNEAIDMVSGIWPKHIEETLLSEGIFCHSFSPKVIVDYEREAYTYPYQKIRLTFDQNIRVSHQCLDFLNPDLGMSPLQEQSQMVFEIKYEDMLPDYMGHIISTAGIKISGYSKYVNGRQMTIM